jgi:hypothetical protein
MDDCIADTSYNINEASYFSIDEENRCIIRYRYDVKDIVQRLTYRRRTMRDEEPNLFAIQRRNVPGKRKNAKTCNRKFMSTSGKML